MKRLFWGLVITSTLFSVGEAKSINKTHQDINRTATHNLINNLNLFREIRTIPAQQNLIGEVTALDQSSGTITVKPEAGASVTVATNDKTAFRRIQPGQTSITNAEQITIATIKDGDR